MKKEIQFVLLILGIGITVGTSMLVYAHATFSTKETVLSMSEQMSVMEKRIYDIHRWVNPHTKER